METPNQGEPQSSVLEKDRKDRARRSLQKFEDAFGRYKLAAKLPDVTDNPEAREAAFEMLENAGMEHRYTGNKEIRAELVGLAPAIRKPLVIAAYRHAEWMATALTSSLQKLATVDDIDEADMAAVEMAVMARDSLCEALSMADDMAQPFSNIETMDIEVVRPWALAHGTVRGVDDAFSNLGVMALVGARILSGAKLAIVTAIPTQAWWLGDIEAAIQADEDRLTTWLIDRVRD